MCMTYDEKATKRFRKKMERNGGTLRCWKVWMRRGADTLKAPFFSHNDGGVIEVSGVIRSNRLAQDPTCETHGMVHHGIHVFRNRAVAARFACGFEAIVPVQCSARDFVAAGLDCGAKGQHAAVFTKVRLLKQDFDAAVKGNGNG